MPQIDDSLLDELLQKLKDNESEEDPLKYGLEKVLNQLLEKEMPEHLNADKYERLQIWPQKRPPEEDIKYPGRHSRA